MFIYDIDKFYEFNTIILGPRFGAAGPFQLRLIARITTLKEVFRRGISICGICEDVVLVAGIKELEGIDSYARLHAFSLRNGEFDNQMLCAFEKVIRVAYDRRTQTLLLIVDSTGNGNDNVDGCCLLVSLTRVANEWVAVQRLGTEPIDLDDKDDVELVLCESRVLLGKYETDTIYGFDVSADHDIRSVGSFHLENVYFFMACTQLDADILVAFSNVSAVSLHRLVEPFRLEPLAHVDLDDPSMLLFRGNLLLVIDSCPHNHNDVVMSLSVDGGRFTGRRKLLDSIADINSQWCIAGDQLVVWDYSSNDLLIYAFD